MYSKKWNRLSYLGFQLSSSRNALMKSPAGFVAPRKAAEPRAPGRVATEESVISPALCMISPRHFMLRSSASSQDSDHLGRFPRRNRTRHCRDSSRRMCTSQLPQLEKSRLLELMACGLAVYLGREQCGVNVCDRRSNRSEYAETFPGVDTSCIKHEEDP